MTSASKRPHLPGNRTPIEGSLRARAAVFVLGPTELERLRQDAPAIPVLIAHRLQESTR